MKFPTVTEGRVLGNFFKEKRKLVTNGIIQRQVAIAIPFMSISKGKCLPLNKPGVLDPM